MTDTRIVCAHDDLRTAQTLQRLLTAEQHSVELSYGRDSPEVLEDARANREAVVVIWSPAAVSALYMLQWAQKIDPARLIEIARSSKTPPLDGRRQPMIDFMNWGGERGGPGWRALKERLRAIARADEPPKPPPKNAAIALGAAGALALGGAMYVRVDDALHGPALPVAQAENDFSAAIISSGDGEGGPLQVIEPDSIDDALAPDLHPRGRHAMLMSDYNGGAMAATHVAPAMQFRQPSLLSRLGSMAAPLLGERSNHASNDQ